VVAVVVRGEEVIIPGGDDHLENNDHVIVFALPEAISQVEQFFA
jgi:trk system potassium uptake protein TrkA